MLKTVLHPSSCRAAITWRMAGWWLGAKRNAIPICSIILACVSGPTDRFTPSAERTSAEPHVLLTLRFPCLTTGIPAPAATNAAAVLILNVCVPSPPVPQVSTSGFRMARVYSDGVFSHHSCKCRDLFRCLAFHAQRSEERPDLCLRCLSLHDSIHDPARFLRVLRSSRPMTRCRHSLNVMTQLPSDPGNF